MLPPAPTASNIATLSNETATVALHLIVPPSIASQLEAKRESPTGLEATSTQRSTQFVSPSTMSLNVVITPSGRAALPVLTFPCTVSSCSAVFLAPVGHDSIALSLTDASGGAGNALSLAAATPIDIRAKVTNPVNLTANPVVASAAVMLGASPATVASTSGGTPVDVPVTLQAYDADQNLIVGPGSYVDATGAPISLSLSVGYSQTGGTGTVTLGGVTRFTAPISAVTVAHYDGKSLLSGTISIKSSGTVPLRLANGTLTIKPTVVAEYPVPTASSGLYGITGGPDGALWFVESLGNNIGRLTLDGSFTEFPVPTANAQPRVITTGPDRNLWFTEYSSAKLGRVTTSGTITEFPTAAGPSALNGITTGPDGNIWVAGGLIERFTTSGSYVAYPLPPNGALHNGYPVGIVPGPGGNLWFGMKYGNIIGYITTLGAYTEYTASTEVSQFREVAAGSDGNIWFTELDTSKIGRMTPDGSYTEYLIPTFNAAPAGITGGPDGSLWFTESGANKIGRLTTDGAFSEYSIPTSNSGPGAITTGSDGNLWFVESSGNKIGKLVY